MFETGLDPSHEVDRRMALARDWDRLVEEVRRLPGFEDFLRPPRLEALLPAAAGGPVAMINVSRWRCDALLVRTSGVDVRPLPGLTLDTAVAKTNLYLDVLHAVDRAALELHAAREHFDGGDHTPAATRRYTNAKFAWQLAIVERDDALESILAWLWDEIAKPVLDALGFTAPPAGDGPWPRLWWCPTGPLTLLPLHAAGHHAAAGTQTVLDRVVSSYTPTLRALLEARRPLEATPDHDRMLLVTLGEAPGAVPLNNVVRERTLLASLFAGRHTLLDGEDAAAGAVLDELPRHRWAHFSCHGGQNLGDPSQGGLLLRDRILTVTDISGRRHDAEFAFLSACMTAVGGTNLPDEVITLAAALHYTGYRHVIGTLWSVYDATAADIAEAVYADLTAGGRFEPAGAAGALHRAVAQLRNDGRPPAEWSPFTHTGP